ncbi:methyltransferase domain-containing protein [Rhodocaloribacter sp.]
MAHFQSLFKPTASTTILDVGGTPYNWNLLDCEAQITLLNLSIPENHESQPPNYHFVKGDGTDLAYPDGAFDIAYSNSVIEHLYTYEQQAKFAAEIRRVGKRVWVQTPARSFFFEPHLITPFVHYLSRTWQRRLLRNFTVWGLLVRPSRERVDQFLEEVRLLGLQEMQALFPDCTIYRERFLFFTKAYIAIRE